MKIFYKNKGKLVYLSAGKLQLGHFGFQYTKWSLTSNTKEAYLLRAYFSHSFCETKVYFLFDKHINFLVFRVWILLLDTFVAYALKYI